MRQFGLIGYPLSHSFSPLYFKNKFETNNIVDCQYNAYPIESIEELTKLIEATPGLEGLNVTIPYKKQVIPFLTDSTQAVVKMNSCNCIKIKGGKLTGYNTDVTGFEQSLKPYLLPKHNRALILGTGGAAAAIEFVLEKLGIEYLLVSRRQDESRNLITYYQLDEQIIIDHTLIINTTPLGMYPSVDNCPDIPYHFVSKDHYFFDLIYNPEETLFLKKGAEKGAIIKNGSDMLYIQAEESWRIWNEDI